MIYIKSVLAVEIRRRVKIPVLIKNPVLRVIYSQKDRSLNWPPISRKKEKPELKNMAESGSTLVDPSLVSVIGLAEDNELKSSEEASTTPVGAKVKKTNKSLEAASSTPEVAKIKKPDKTPDSKVAKGKSAKKRHSSPVKSSTVSTDHKLEAMDLKWSECFSRLEAMLLSKSQSSCTFLPVVKVTPVKPPPAGALDTSEPFFAPTTSTDLLLTAQQASDRPQPVDRPACYRISG